MGFYILCDTFFAHCTSKTHPHLNLKYNPPSVASHLQTIQIAIDKLLVQSYHFLKTLWNTPKKIATVLWARLTTNWSWITYFSQNWWNQWMTLYIEIQYLPLKGKITWLWNHWKISKLQTESRRWSERKKLITWISFSHAYLKFYGLPRIPIWGAFENKKILSLVK